MSGWDDFDAIYPAWDISSSDGSEHRTTSLGNIFGNLLQFLRPGISKIIKHIPYRHLRSVWLLTVGILKYSYTKNNNKQIVPLCFYLISIVYANFQNLLCTFGPQTYLQRPSSWGRATAGRQDVVSHVHTAMRKVYSLHSSSRQM